MSDERPGDWHGEDNRLQHVSSGASMAGLSIFGRQAIEPWWIFRNDLWLLGFFCTHAASMQPSGGAVSHTGL